MSEDNRKYYNKLSGECMVFSLVGVSLLMIICGSIRGEIRYLSAPAYIGLLLIGAAAFVTGLIGHIVTRKGKHEENPTIDR